MDMDVGHDGGAFSMAHHTDSSWRRPGSHDHNHKHSNIADLLREKHSAHSEHTVYDQTRCCEDHHTFFVDFLADFVDAPAA
eukprot:2471128-Amphidinium_carterae.1